VHGLAYPLGGKYNISHGLSNSIFLVDVMEFNTKAVPEKFIRVAQAIEIQTTNFPKEKIVKSVVDKIRKLVNMLALPLKDSRFLKRYWIILQ